jgi:uncharacterized protein (DUF2062 family)
MIRSLDPRRVWRMVLDLLKMGLTPEKLALTIVLGAVIGILPVLGSTTILCGAVAVALGLNLPVIQAVNYLVYPLQIVMIIPFIRIGEWIFGSPRLAMTATEIVTFVTNDPMGAISALWWVTLQALVAWVLFALASSALIYPLLVPVLRRFAPAEEVAR